MRIVTGGSGGHKKRIFQRNSLAHDTWRHWTDCEKRILLSLPRTTLGSGSYLFPLTRAKTPYLPTYPQAAQRSE